MLLVSASPRMCRVTLRQRVFPRYADSRASPWSGLSYRLCTAAYGFESKSYKLSGCPVSRSYNGELLPSAGNASRVTRSTQYAQDLQLVYNPYEIYVRARYLSAVTYAKGPVKFLVLLAPPAKQEAATYPREIRRTVSAGFNGNFRSWLTRAIASKSS